MALKFSCPHCRKGIRVKEELAGKKAKCPACQQVLTIPTVARSTGPQPAKPTTESDLEAQALAALAEQSKAPATPDGASTKTISFQCPFCDEKISLSADLVGKRAPCPECRRIIKVPLPQSAEPKDWRKVDVRSPITRDHKGEPAPEGAWGSEVSRGRVSRQALLEAGALPVVKEKWTLRQWTNRIALAVIAVFVLVVSVWAVIHFSFESRKGGAFTQAEKLVAESKDPLTAAEVYRGLGVYQFRAEKPVGDNNSAKAARDQFLKARAKLTETSGESAERDAILIDLALDQVDLGSDSEEAQKRGIRLNWDDAVKEVHRTLQHIKSPEARLQGLRLVERKFLDSNLPNIAARLPDAILGPNDPDRAEALAQYGLLIIDQKEQANAQATQALQAFTPLKKNAKASPETYPPSLVALLVALDRKDLKELPETPPKENPPLEQRVGFTWAWAYRGQLGEARALATSDGPASHQLQALIALIAALVEKKADIEVDLKAALERVQPALKLKEKALKAALDRGERGEPILKLREKGGNALSWTLYYLVQLAVRAGKGGQVGDMAKLQMPDPDLRGRAELEIVSGVYDPLGGEASLGSSTYYLIHQHTGATPFCRHAVLVYSRQIARYGSSWSIMKDIDRWWQPELKPLGYVGVALGMQDREK